MKKRGVSIMQCNANERVRSKLLKTGILKMVGEQNYFHSFAAAANHCGTLVEGETPYLPICLPANKALLIMQT